MGNVISIVRTFSQDEDGATFVEYLVVLGVITALVIGAISFFGGAIANTFGAWGSWMQSNAQPP